MYFDKHAKVSMFLSGEKSSNIQKNQKDNTIRGLVPNMTNTFNSKTNIAYLKHQLQKLLIGNIYT